MEIEGDLHPIKTKTKKQRACMRCQLLKSEQEVDLLFIY